MATKKRVVKQKYHRVGHGLRFCFKCWRPLTHGNAARHHKLVHDDEPLEDLTMCLVPRDAIRPLPRKLMVDAMTNTSVDNTIISAEELPFTVQDLAAQVLRSYYEKKPPCDGCYWQDFQEFANHDYGCKATVERIVELHMTNILDALDKPVHNKLRIQLAFEVADIVRRSEIGTLV